MAAPRRRKPRRTSWPGRGFPEISDRERRHRLACRHCPNDPGTLPRPGCRRCSCFPATARDNHPPRSRHGNGLERLMSFNTFGHLFRVTTFGESHGPALGCVVDGCPPGIPLTEIDIQAELDRRRPGQSKFVSQRKEPDQVRILSGVFQDERMPEQLTTGTPIALLIENVDAKSRDYSDIRDKYRPGHADYTYWAKYGVRDY